MQEWVHEMFQGMRSLERAFSELIHTKQEKIITSFVNLKDYTAHEAWGGQ